MPLDGIRRHWRQRPLWQRRRVAWWRRRLHANHNMTRAVSGCDRKPELGADSHRSRNLNRDRGEGSVGLDHILRGRTPAERLELRFSVAECGDDDTVREHRRRCVPASKHLTSELATDGTSRSRSLRGTHRRRNVLHAHAAVVQLQNHVAVGLPSVIGEDCPLPICGAIGNVFVGEDDGDCLGVDAHDGGCLLRKSRHQAICCPGHACPKEPQERVRSRASAKAQADVDAPLSELRTMAVPW